MAIPDFQSLMLPLLRLSADNAEHAMHDVIARLADECALTEAERAELLPSGRQRRFANRVHWAKAYLFKAAIFENTRRGHFRITQRGHDVLRENPSRVDLRYLTRFPEISAFRGAESTLSNDDDAVVPSDVETPVERILSAEHEIETALQADLLARLKAAPPAFFEDVVLKLLGKLGYDGRAERTGGSGDGGIDGVIDEDKLGLDRIYVQAKRYGSNAVAAEAVRAFSGALDDAGARKGVFLTTSMFTRDALAYAQRQQSKRIVLIDGDRLTGLMILHDVGVRVDRRVVIKKIDLDVFEPDEA
jgi:restriction system protein